MPEQNQQPCWKRFENHQGPTHEEVKAARTRVRTKYRPEIREVLRGEPNCGIQHGVSRHRGVGKNYR
jgi:hypothetical protein